MSAFDSLIEHTARAIARRHDLVDENGAIWCWQCGQKLALMPSLHCGPCLGAAYIRQRITSPYCVNRQQRPTTER